MAFANLLICTSVLFLKATVLASPHRKVTLDNSMISEVVLNETIEANAIQSQDVLAAQSWPAAPPITWLEDRTSPLWERHDSVVALFGNASNRSNVVYGAAFHAESSQQMRTSSLSQVQRKEFKQREVETRLITRRQLHEDRQILVIPASYPSLGLVDPAFFQRYTGRREFNRWHLLLDNRTLSLAAGDAVFAQTHLAPLTVPQPIADIQRVIQRKAHIRFSVVHIFSPALFFAILTRLRYKPPNSQTQNYIQPDRDALSIVIRDVCHLVDWPHVLEMVRRRIWNLPVRIWNPPQALINFFNDLANGDGIDFEVFRLKETLLLETIAIMGDPSRQQDPYSFTRDMRRMTKAQLQIARAYLRMIRPQYRAVLSSLQTYLNRLHPLLLGRPPPPGTALLGDSISLMADAAMNRTLLDLNAVLAPGLELEWHPPPPGVPEFWHGEIDTTEVGDAAKLARLMRYPTHLPDPAPVAADGRNGARIGENSSTGDGTEGGSCGGDAGPPAPKRRKMCQ